MLGDIHLRHRRSVPRLRPSYYSVSYEYVFLDIKAPVVSLFTTHKLCNICFRKVVCASNNKDKCYRLDYKDVLMHAICKDTEYCPKPCLYLQLEATKLEAQRSSASEQEQTEEHIEEQPEEPLEVRFVPEDSSQCTLAAPSFFC